MAFGVRCFGVSVNKINKLFSATFFMKMEKGHGIIELKHFNNLGI